MKEAPAKRLLTGGFQAWVVERDVNLHAAIVLHRPGHAMEIQWATAEIPAGCDNGATHEKEP